MSDNDYGHLTKRELIALLRLTEATQEAQQAANVKLAAALAEAERQRDWHRDDAAMVRRERNAEARRLAAELAEEERAGDALNEALAQSEVERRMLAHRLGTAEGRVVPQGLALRGQDDPRYPVIWKWANDWDWHGAASIVEAITEAERRRWRPKGGYLPGPDAGEDGQ